MDTGQPYIDLIRRQVKATEDHLGRLPTHTADCSRVDRCGACRARAWLLGAKQDLVDAERNLAIRQKEERDRR